jgi:hypothetical protein
MRDPRKYDKGEKIMVRTKQIVAIPLFALFFGRALLLTTGCGREGSAEDKPKVSAEEVRKETGEALEVTKEFMAGRIADYQEEMEKMRARLAQRIEELEKKAAKAREEAQEDLQATMDELRKKLETVEESFKKLESASGKAWKELESGFQSALEEFEKTAG